jgi:phosphoribosyl 1,2-cyclic phosphodiesterase
MSVFSLSLRSGSSGNSTYIRTDSARIAVDCGITGKQFALALRSIGEDANAVDALLLTHEHIDHCSGIGVVMRRFGIPLYTTKSTFEGARDILGNINESLVYIIEPGKAFSIRDTVVLPFSVPHDASDPVGFRIFSAGGDIGVVTDLGHFSSEVKNSLEGCRVVYLEANFDPELLESGYYPQLLKRRIAGSRGHLSNLDAGDAAVQLLHSGTEAFALCHLSRDNNRPSLALKTVSERLLREGARAGRDYVINASPRYECSRVFHCRRSLDEQDKSLPLLHEESQATGNYTQCTIEVHQNDSVLQLQGKESV